jgi:hypothetical protein
MLSSGYSPSSNNIVNQMFPREGAVQAYSSGIPSMRWGSPAGLLPRNPTPTTQATTIPTATSIITPTREDVNQQWRAQQAQRGAQINDDTVVLREPEALARKLCVAQLCVGRYLDEGRSTRHYNKDCEYDNGINAMKVAITSSFRIIGLQSGYTTRNPSD